MPRILLASTFSLGDVIHNLRPSPATLRRACPTQSLIGCQTRSPIFPALQPARLKCHPRGHAAAGAVRFLGAQPGTKSVASGADSSPTPMTTCRYPTPGAQERAYRATRDGGRCGQDRQIARASLLAARVLRLAPIRWRADGMRWRAIVNSAAALAFRLFHAGDAAGLRPASAVRAAGVVTTCRATMSLCLHGSSRGTKLWPESHWIALTRALTAKRLTPLLPWGSETEHVRAEAIAAG